VIPLREMAACASLSAIATNLPFPKATSLQSDSVESLFAGRVELSQARPSVE
jgi:hypothetical protein